MNCRHLIMRLSTKGFHGYLLPRFLFVVVLECLGQQEAKKDCGMIAISYFCSAFLLPKHIDLCVLKSESAIDYQISLLCLLREGGVQGAQIRETQALQLWQALRCYSTLWISLKRPKFGFEVRMHRVVVLSIEVGPAGSQKVQDRTLCFGIPSRQLELPSSIVSFQRNHWRRIIISRCWKLKKVSNCRQRPTRVILAARDLF
jgi:hypothetical protein